MTGASADVDPNRRDAVGGPAIEYARTEARLDGFSLGQMAARV